MMCTVEMNSVHVLTPKHTCLHLNIAIYTNCVHACIHICVRMYTYIYSYTRTHTHIHNKYIDAYIHMHTCRHYFARRMCVYIRTYTYIYINTHTHTHTTNTWFVHICVHTQPYLRVVLEVFGAAETPSYIHAILQLPYPTTFDVYVCKCT